MRRFKNITIVILIVSAFIQLSYIWSISVPNIFAPSYEVTVSEEYRKDILAPNKVYIKQGDIFKIAYSTYRDDDSNRDTNRAVISLLNEIVSKGEYVENTTLTTDLLYDVEEIYCYPSVIDKELLSSVLGYKGNNLNKTNLTFDYLYVNEDEKLVYFYNSKSSEVFTFNAENLEKFNVPKTYKFNSNIEYKYDNTSDVNNDVFLTPIVVEGDYLNINKTNPYSENDETLVSTVEPKINRFFKSPNEKWTIKGEESYIFSGEDIQVKYYYNNVVEYNNNNDSSKKTDIATAYAIARSYIDLDEFVTNDIILKKFENTENSYKFYFNPVVNNTEIVFNNEQLDYYIEIEVTNGIVKKYKKYGLNYSSGYNVTDIENSTSSILELGQHIDNVELVYLQSMEEDLKVSLHWSMFINGESVYTQAQID